VPGLPALTDAERRVVANFVTPGWFATYGTAIRIGRDVEAGDTANTVPVAVVNETFARRFLSGQSAIGAVVRGVGPDAPGRTVVGVVADAAFRSLRPGAGASDGLRDEVPPTIYYPLAQSTRLQPPGATAIRISVRARSGPPALLSRSVGAALTTVDRNLAFSVRSLEDYLDAALAQERLIATLSSFFGGLALLLAGVGLYGVTSYAVSRRRMEIGIRLALGADPPGVARMMLSRVSRLVLLGVITGACISLWASRFIAPLLFALPPRDPGTLIAAAATLAAVAALAGGLPAFRASRIDPADVLRQS